MLQYYRVMATGDDDRPERPEYNVYRSGGSSGRRAKKDAGKPAKSPAKGSSASSGSSGSKPPDSGPGYSVYRSRRRFGKLGSADFASMRERLRSDRRKSDKRKDREDSGEKPLWRKIGRWALIGAGVWILLSIVLFCISAQIQSSKLNGATADELGGFPLMVASPQTILVMGTDARPEGTDEGGAETDPKCLEAAAHGDPAPSSCLPSRADTLMLVRAGGGKFEKLSIPRDTFAAIPGQDAQKINAAYAFGGAKLEVQTVEDFLGIDIDHVVILDFEGFADFIDAVGGVEVALRAPVKSKISGGSSNGGITLKLEKGRNTLDGQQALALARTRENEKDPSEDDTARAQRQQLILNGIKDRLTSPTRLPYNFIHAPWIAWNAPKAMVSDMGAWTLPQLVASAAIGGNSKTKILKPSGSTASGALVVDGKECEKAVKDFLGEAGPRNPECSPAG